jgi:large conductance mechanosensitive channel
VNQVKDFKAFLLRGNVIDLAIAVVIGLAFGAVITAFVRDLITPLIAIPGKTNFASLHFTVNGSTFSYGDFVNYLVAFVVLAAVIFFVVVKPLGALIARRQRDAAATTKTCEHCASTIPAAARVCAFCTREVST